MTPLKMFVTGASGYIGGAVGRRLVAEGHQVRALVRKPDAAQALARAGLTPVLGTLDDVETLAREARAADAVLNIASADHPGAVDTFAQALAGSGKPFIHTSGSSLVGDRAAGEPSGRVYAEDAPPTPEPEMRERAVMNQRVVDLASDNVRSMVIVPSMVYGDAGSIQVPMLITQSRSAQAGVHIGRGLNRWSNVHIDDLVDLYLLALDKAGPGETFYVGTGDDASLRDIAVAISRLLGFGGTTLSVPIDEAKRAWGAFMAELGLGNNSRVSSEKARRVLGWAPTRPGILADIEHGSYATSPLRPSPGLEKH